MYGAHRALARRVADDMEAAREPLALVRRSELAGGHSEGVLLHVSIARPRSDEVGELLDLRAGLWRPHHLLLRGRRGFLLGGGGGLLLGCLLLLRLRGRRRHPRRR